MRQLRILLRPCFMQWLCRPSQVSLEVATSPLLSSEFFPALGAAMSSPPNYFHLPEIAEKIKNWNNILNNNNLKPLFEDKSDYEQWKQNRNVKLLCFKPLSEQNSANENPEGLFLGIDSGSTTTKIVLIDNEQRIVYQNYTSNEGFTDSCRLL